MGVGVRVGLDVGKLDLIVQVLPAQARSSSSRRKHLPSESVSIIVRIGFIKADFKGFLLHACLLTDFVNDGRQNVIEFV